MKEILYKYRERLINLSGRNRSLVSMTLPKKRAFDILKLNKLFFFYNYILALVCQYKVFKVIFRYREKHKAIFILSLISGEDYEIEMILYSLSPKQSDIEQSEFLTYQLKLV